MKKEVTMGCLAKCKVTGFKGIVTGKCVYLNGCIQWLLKPKMQKDGKFPDGQWIDVQHLEYVSGGVNVDSKDVGGSDCSEDCRKN